MSGEAEDFSDVYKDGKVRIQFFAYKTGEVYERYPADIFSGLSKIGGLLGILKLLSFIQYYHQASFEKSLKAISSSQHRI
jgi:hypothetical protein